MLSTCIFALSLYVQLNRGMTVYQEQISLTNSRIRLALKQGDTKSVFDATLQLCQGDQNKADLLASWFKEVAERCKNKTKINRNISMMRMWQLGNMDIKEVSKEGDPIFGLTITGLEKIRNVQKKSWLEVLLWDGQKLPA